MKSQVIIFFLFFVIILGGLFYLDYIDFYRSLGKDFAVIMWAISILVFLLVGIIVISLVFQYFASSEGKKSIKSKAL